MLNPEMTPEIEETLYSDALNIYTTYLDPQSPDHLNLPAYISQGMEQSKQIFVFAKCMIFPNHSRKQILSTLRYQSCGNNEILSYLKMGSIELVDKT